MKKILITGGAGFIGSNLARAYSEKGFEIAILDNFSSGSKTFVSSQFQLFEGNIGNKDFVETVFAKFKPEIVSHHAAHISVRNSLEYPDFDAKENILGSINVFDAAGKNNVENVVFASSGGVMIPSSCHTFPSPEQDGNLLLNSPYALSKFCAEKYARFFAEKYGFRATIFRYANVYGPRQTPKGEAGVISIFLENVFAGKRSIIFGDGMQTRDFLFVDDLVKAHFLATEKNCSGTFHLGTGVETSILALYKEIARQTGFDKMLEFKEANSGELLRSCLDSSLFRSVSGWESSMSLEEGIRRTVEWWKERT